MDILASLKKVRNDFHPTFWVANGMELFERLAYYGQQIVFMIYMRNRLGFTEAEAGQLSGMFGGLIYLLPILGGTLADKWGFRRAFNIAFSVLALGYFLIGSMGMSAFSGIYGGAPQYWLMMAFLILTAFGGSFIKPSVLGTVAVTSKPETKSLGYAIYYWLVNVGAMIGPTIAYFVRDSFGNEFVYLVSSASCLAVIFIATGAGVGEDDWEVLLPLFPPPAILPTIPSKIKARITVKMGCLLNQPLWSAPHFGHFVAFGSISLLHALHFFIHLTPVHVLIVPQLATKC